MSQLHETFSLIAAVALNGVIGGRAANALPWRLPADLRHFKQYTLGKTVVMGANTFASLGRALPGRRNVVLTREAFTTRDLTARFPGVDACYCSLSAARFNEGGELVVIGGGQVYAEALRWRPSELCITVVDLEPVGDVYFPLEGHRFLADHVDIPVGLGNELLTYDKTYDSDWQADNDITFKIVKYSPSLP